MADNVKVQLTFATDEGAPGDEVEVSRARARTLINVGVAQAATKPDAKKAGVDPDTAATAK